jgi:hypothetical protein
MTLLADVLDPAELATAVEMGHVRMQSHPSRPLTIYFAEALSAEPRTGKEGWWCISLTRTSASRSSMPSTSASTGSSRGSPPVPSGKSWRRAELFLRLDNKDYRPGLWQRARPEGDMTPHGTKVSEE